MERLRFPDDPTRRAIVALVLATAVLYLVIATVTVFTFVDSHAKDRQIKASVANNCDAINDINRVVRTQLERSKVNIPKLDYYKHHPEELQRQLFVIDQQIKDFRDRQC